MSIITLSREDICNPLHPFLWEQMCEELGVDMDSDTLTLYVRKAEGDEAETS